MLALQGTSIQRRRILLQGMVQGVGFRPFVYRLSLELGLYGFVCNSSKGVTIEIEGSGDGLEIFIARLNTECPPHAVIQNIEISPLLIQKDEKFLICSSEVELFSEAVILPDMATCSACLSEVFDPRDRRYLYPFTNCMHCGPRYSIIEKLPYDRKNTSMKKFIMCAECQLEYNDPANRRFHAQPNACPACGPQLQLLDPLGRILAKENEALTKAVSHLSAGQILALKGLGGFQLMVDARNDKAVGLLRERKHRSEKPLAMMFPTLDRVKEYCKISIQEEKTLLSAQAPIVLCPKRIKALIGTEIAPSVAFDSPLWGVMLPYTPLHHFLMQKFANPLVATSANFSEEPMCIDNDEALEKLSTIADYFLVHDRPIVRPVDDSVGIMIRDQFSITRRARGFAPLPVLIDDNEANGLALGAQMKNTIALKIKDKVHLSQHLGDLHSMESRHYFNQSIQSLRGLYAQALDYVAVDLHPEYHSTTYACGLKEKVISVQHHHAHVVSCMAEHNLHGPVLGLAWDGTGLGDDQIIWGSEFLVATRSEFKRVGHLYPFRLPGGEAAIRQPKRAALGLLANLSENNFDRFKELSVVKLFSKLELENIQRMLNKGALSPLTTSMGRLFDGVSAMLGLCPQSTYEGQAAMLLEHLIVGKHDSGLYSWTFKEVKSSVSGECSKYILDWRPMLLEIITNLKSGEEKISIAAKFHNTLVEMAVDVSRHVGLPQVVLSGGCFQNRYLTERLIDRLKAEGFDVYWHSQVPTNDGGIALGQAVIAATKWKKNKDLKSCA